MGADLRALCEAGERAGWVLTVGTAIEFLQDRPVPTACIGSVWRPCQVTLFSERLYMATHQVEAVELQLDVSSYSHAAAPRYRWLVMRGREPDERVYVPICVGSAVEPGRSRRTTDEAVGPIPVVRMVASAAGALCSSAGDSRGGQTR